MRKAAANAAAKAARLRQPSGAELAAALENGLICVILLIAIGAALYILNGQIIRLL